MENKTLHLIILEDNPDDAELIASELKREGFTVEWSRVDTEEAFRKALEEKPDLILADYSLPSFDGLSSIRIQQRLAPEIPLIIVSGTIGEELAVECMRSGATDYVLKNRLHRLVPMVRRALDEAEEHRKRRKAEEALRESEEKFRYLVKNSDNVFVIIDENGKEIFVSDSVERITGFSPAETMGHSGFEFLHPDDVDHMSKTLSKLLKTPGGTVQNEYRHRRKEGGWVYLETIGTNYLLEPSIKGIVLNVRDITERKRAEEELRKSETRYRSVFENTGTAIVIVEEDTTISMANIEFERLSGYSREEIEGKMSWTEFVVKEDLERMKEYHAKRREKGEDVPAGYEFRFVDKQGNIKDILLKTDMIPGSKRSVASLIDITERKRGESALKESEEKYRLHFENVSDVIFSLDANFKVISVSPSVEKLLGYKPEELTGISFKDLNVLAPESLEKAFSDSMRVLGGETIALSVYEFIAKDGTKKYGEVSGAPLIRDGKIVSILSIARDITDRKRMEKELEQSFKSLRKGLRATIKVLVAAVEVRDPYTAGHQSRVADLARAIATEMGLPKEKIEGIRVAGAIHDIGKISVPSEILSKPGSLNDIEFGLITPHPQVGYDILKDIEFPWPVALIVLQHHERMDGSGYPQGLSGEEICLEARIMGVADVVEAMSSHRPYRPALGTDKALEEISRNKGTLYDPEVVDACVRLFTEKGFRLE